MAIGPHPGLISPKGKVSQADESSSHPCCPVSSDARSAPLPCPVATTIHHHHPAPNEPPLRLFLQALPGFLHTHFSADAPARPQGVSRGPRSVGQNSMLKTSRVRKAHPCDPQLQGGRHPPSTPPLTIPPPPRVNGWGRRGAPPCRTEAPSPGRTWAGAVSHSAMPPVSPGGLGQGSLPPSPPLPPLPATSSSADWPTLGAMRNSRSNKVPGPHVLGSRQTPAGLGAVGTVAKVKGPPLPGRARTGRRGP